MIDRKQEKVYNCRRKEVKVMDEKMTLGEFVAQYRKRNHLSLREFAKRCDCSYQYIYNLEKGEVANPSYEMVKRIADAVGLTAFDLMSKLDGDQVYDFSDIFDAGPNFKAYGTGSELEKFQAAKAVLDQQQINTEILASAVGKKFKYAYHDKQKALLIILGFKNADELMERVYKGEVFDIAEYIGEYDL